MRRIAASTEDGLPSGVGRFGRADSAGDSPFTPVRSLRLSEEIIRQIARLVEDGSLKLDDRFPTERDLQERWQVSRPVLREAFRVLEMQGVVESRPGAGRYLRSNRIPDPSRFRQAHLQANREDLLQVWDAREAVEAKAAELAAIHASPAQVGAIRKAVKKLTSGSLEDLQRFDFNREFHLAVAEASCNPTIIDMIATLIGRSNKIGFRAVMDPAGWDALPGRHMPILDAIAARDPAAARRAVINHFDGMRESVRDL
jgi:GntR family transcriptional regulator, transcriptional repressor for pyruvate dehydrogenase complex